uniref:LSDAT_euk domain-containing protein n=1 Tax=Rodentolepis nana TaxID=102285 RepID=A0A0R3TI71_RODNA
LTQFTQLQGGHKSRVPVVGVLIEGGQHAFRRVLDLLTGENPIPVVICDGSGRAADLLAFMSRYADSDGDLVPKLRRQVVANIERTFQLNRSEAESLYLDMKGCMCRRDLLSVFQMGDETSSEIDLTILTALLQGKLKYFHFHFCYRNSIRGRKLCAYPSTWKCVQNARLQSLANRHIGSFFCQKVLALLRKGGYK